MEVANSSQNLPVEVADTWGPLGETGVPLVRDVGPTLGRRCSSEEAGVVGRVVSGDMGPPEVTNCPQTVPIGKVGMVGRVVSGDMGPSEATDYP